MAVQNPPSEESIADSIRQVGFAAAIEVTNHLVRPDYKAKQARNSQRYLEQIAGDDSIIYAGLAFNYGKGCAHYVQDMDFTIEINTINAERMESVAEEMKTTYLSKGKNGVLERLLKKKCSGPFLLSVFSKANTSYTPRHLGIRRSEIAPVKKTLLGLGLEIYMIRYLEEAIPGSSVFLRYGYVYDLGNGDGPRPSDLDNLVICPKDDFKYALMEMDKSKEFTVRFGTSNKNIYPKIL